jgi:5,10-methylenetetrahydrofolate reductase
MQVETLQPHYVTLTWRSTFKDEELSLRICKQVQEELHVNVLMHLTCHLEREAIKRILRRAKDAGKRSNSFTSRANIYLPPTFNCV